MAKKTRSKKRCKAPHLNKKVTPDSKLAKIIGSASICRSDILRKLWNHIRSYAEQDGRKITLSAEMRNSGIWGAARTVEMTQLGKALKHTKK